MTTEPDFHDYHRDRVMADPIDVDAGDEPKWEDGRGPDRAIYDARKQHAIALEHLVTADGSLYSLNFKRPARPRPVKPLPVVRMVDRPNARDAMQHSKAVAQHGEAVAEHSEATAELVEKALREIGGLRTTLAAVLCMLLAQNRCLDDVTRALAQMRGKKARFLMQAVYEARDQIEPLLPFTQEHRARLEAEQPTAADFDEFLKTLLHDNLAAAKVETHNVLARR